MTNDLSTLNGALLEMKDQLIYELGQKGVTASYSSSDGLLGLIGKISEIQTGGGSCYKVTFDNASYTTTGSATISVTVLKNYNACVGETVTFTSSTSTTTTATTDSNGVATATISFSGSTTLTASIDGVSDTATVTKISALFYDDCSTDRTSDYEWISVNNFYGTPSTWSYDSTNHCYNLGTGSTTDHFYGAIAKNISVGSCKITAKVQVNSSGNVQIGVGLHNNNDTTVQIVSRLVKTNNTISMLKVYPDTFIANTSQSLSTNTDYIIEFIYDDGDLTFNLYNSSNTLLKTLTGTTNLLGSNNAPMIYFAFQSNQTAKLKEFKVEAL